MITGIPPYSRYSVFAIPNLRVFRKYTRPIHSRIQIHFCAVFSQIQGTVYLKFFVNKLFGSKKFKKCYGIFKDILHVN